jgi:hypothetical protein
MSTFDVLVFDFLLILMLALKKEYFLTPELNIRCKEYINVLAI